MNFVRNLRPQRGNCFVIMPYGIKELSDGTDFDCDTHYKEVIATTITERLGMTPIRADEIYGATPLMERVWKGIQEAEVVVVDLTGRSPNVLYELGLAHLIGKRIILLTMYPEDVPVDLAEFVRLQYSTTGIDILQLTRALEVNLKAAISEPAAEMMLTPLVGGGVERIKAKVLSTGTDYAAVEAQDGRKGFLHADDFSWTRRKVDLTRLLHVGQELEGAFVVDVVNGQSKYSLTAVTENPWPKLQQEFAPGAAFTGTVRAAVPNVGVFVGLRYGVDGLVPASLLPPGQPITSGTVMEGTVFRLDPVQREVELRFARIAAPAPGLGVDRDEVTERVERAEVSRVVRERGFVIVRLGDGSTELLNIRKMSASLAARLQDSRIDLGEAVDVIVAVGRDGRRELSEWEAATSGADSGETTSLLPGDEVPGDHTEAQDDES